MSRRTVLSVTIFVRAWCCSEPGDSHCLLSSSVRHSCSQAMKCLSSTQACLLAIWCTNDTHFSTMTVELPPRVCEHHQRWLEMDGIQFLNISISFFVVAFVSFFTIDLAKCQTSNWCAIWPKSSRIIALIWALRSVATWEMLNGASSRRVKRLRSPSRSIVPLLKLVIATCINSKSKIKFVVASINVYVQYLAEYPGLSHRPSPQSLRFSPLATMCKAPMWSVQTWHTWQGIGAASGWCSTLTFPRSQGWTGNRVGEMYWKDNRWKGWHWLAGCCQQQHGLWWAAIASLLLTRSLSYLLLRLIILPLQIPRFPTRLLLCNSLRFQHPPWSPPRRHLTCCYKLSHEIPFKLILFKMWRAKTITLKGFKQFMRASWRLHATSNSTHIFNPFLLQVSVLRKFIKDKFFPFANYHCCNQEHNTEPFWQNKRELKHLRSWKTESGKCQNVARVDGANHCWRHHAIAQ